MQLKVYKSDYTGRARIAIRVEDGSYPPEYDWDLRDYEARKLRADDTRLLQNLITLHGLPAEYWRLNE